MKSIIQFSLQNRRKPFIIETVKDTIYTKYSFLESHVRMIPNTINNQTLQMKGLQNYLKALRSYSMTIGQLQNRELTEQDFSHQIIQDVSESFLKLKSDISIELTKNNHQQIVPLTELMYSTNIIDHQLWHKALTIGSKNYQKMDLTKKYKFIGCALQYFQKYNFIYEKMPNHFKFVFRETSLNDLIDFEYFLLFTEEQKFFQSEDGSQFGVRLKLLKNRMKIIQKVRKSVDLNFYTLKHNYLSLQSAVMKNTMLMTLEDLVEIYQFYSNISAVTYEFVQLMEGQIGRKFIQQAQNMNTYNKKQFVKRLTQIWKNQGRYNQNLFESIIQPEMNKIIQEQEAKEYITQKQYNLFKYLVYNLLCSGAFNRDLITRIMNILTKNNQIKAKNNQSDKIIHIINHILSFRKQKQNDPLSKNVTVSTKQIKQCHHFMSQASIKQAISHNAVQIFWFNIIREVVGHKSVYKSKYICVFQLDVLVQYQGYKFAFQIQGSHYSGLQKKVNSQSDVSDQKVIKTIKIIPGKKKLKKEILEGFGINMIDLHCQDAEAKVIMRFMLKEKGKNYIQKLLKQAVIKMQQKQEEDKKHTIIKHKN